MMKDEIKANKLIYAQKQTSLWAKDEEETFILLRRQIRGIRKLEDELRNNEATFKVSEDFKAIKTKTDKNKALVEFRSPYKIKLTEMNDKRNELEYKMKFANQKHKYWIREFELIQLGFK